MYFRLFPRGHLDAAQKASLQVTVMEARTPGNLPPAFSHHVTPIDNLAQQFVKLRERKVDLILARISQFVEEDITPEVRVGVRYDQNLFVAHTAVAQPA